MLVYQGSYGHMQSEGFWSAVVSVIASGIVLALLLIHWSLEFKRDPSKDDQPSASSHTKLQIRVAGRHFMLQNTMLIALIALTALIFSRIEKWTYLQGIYFTIVTFLTIGFGDFYPSRPSTKVLLFFLGLLGITLLASCISMIVSFFNDHQREHKAKARAEREKAWHMSQMKTDNPSLQREIAFLKSLAGFLVFWFVGAAIFSAVESWPYGDGLYFCYVFFLSIGYGDLAPVSPAGRVIFIVYSLMAVPIMASFAVQAIQNILERLSEQRMDRRRAEMGDETSQAIAEVQLREKKSESNGNKESPDEMHSTLAAPMNADDLKALLDYAVSLERVARRLLVAHLAEGSPAQILLRADWNLQSRDLRLLESESQGRSSGQPRAGNGFGNESKADGAHRARMKGLAAIEAGVAGTAESREEREEEEIAVTAVGGMDDEETLKAELEVRPCMIYLELF
ncbi:ion channel protein, partial [Rhizoctonia solani AG-3 Rhs1AP]